MKDTMTTGKRTRLLNNSPLHTTEMSISKLKVSQAAVVQHNIMLIARATNKQVRKV